MNVRVHVSEKTEGYLELLLAMLTESSMGDLNPDSNRDAATKT